MIERRLKNRLLLKLNSTRMIFQARIRRVEGFNKIKSESDGNCDRESVCEDEI